MLLVPKSAPSSLLVSSEECANASMTWLTLMGGVQSAIAIFGLMHRWLGVFLKLIRLRFDGDLSIESKKLEQLLPVDSGHIYFAPTSQTEAAPDESRAAVKLFTQPARIDDIVSGFTWQFEEHRDAIPLHAMGRMNDFMWPDSQCEQAAAASHASRSSDWGTDYPVHQILRMARPRPWGAPGLQKQRQGETRHPDGYAKPQKAPSFRRFIKKDWIFHSSEKIAVPTAERLLKRR